MRGFRPGWALTCQVAVALATVTALSFWQFSRGQEKAALAAERDQRLAAPALAAEAFSSSTPDFTRLALAGRYDGERSFFIIDRAQPWRYLVVTPFVTNHGVFLATRGRAERPRAGALSAAEREGPPLAREALRTPEIETPSGLVAVAGVLWPEEGAADTSRWPEGWPKAVNGMNVPAMAELTGAHPREVRLEEPSAGLAPVSLAYDYSPGTHWSYAVQWLLIGVAIVAGYIFFGRRRSGRPE